MDGPDHDGKWHPALGVGLRVEKDLHMTHRMPGRPLQVRHGKVVEILFLS
jgi:hypothetical protein